MKIKNEREEFMTSIARKILLWSVAAVHFAGTIAGSLVVAFMVTQACFGMPDYRSYALPLGIATCIAFGSMGHESRKGLVKFIDAKFSEKK